jgi:hypothetical protein
MYLKPIDKTIFGDRIRTPEPPEINEFYPLPKDYLDLSKNGQRLARVNACSLQRTPEEYVVAWDFFRHYYLYPWDGCLLYSGYRVPSPPFHYEMTHAMATHQYATRACPRGYAKSTVLDENVLLRLITRRMYIILMVFASFSIQKERFGIFQDVLMNCPAMLDDFDVLPSKGSGLTFNLEVLWTRFRSRIKGTVTGGKKRGTRPRPNWIAMDDPEYDGSESTDLEKLRREFRTHLFKILLPAGQKGAQFWWPGTMISKQTSLYLANSGQDPQYSQWDNRVYSAIITHPDGSRESLWPEHMSLEELDQLALDLGDYFGSEYLNQPGDSLGSSFKVHPDLCNYELDRNESLPPRLDMNPITYTVKTGEDNGQVQTTTIEEPLAALTEKLFIFMTVDLAYTQNADSDFSAISVVGVDKKYDCMFVLDCWQGKVATDQLIRKIVELGTLWNVSLVAVEAVLLQVIFYEQVAAAVKDLKSDWNPSVIPIAYRGATSDKAKRIAALSWRFNNFRIKFPLAKEKSGHWAEMMHQVRHFCSGVKDGNLQHDDLIDTLAMTQFVGKTSERLKLVEDVRQLKPIDHIRNGEMVHPDTGIPWAAGINLDELTANDIFDTVNFEQEPRNPLASSLGKP